MKTYVTDTMKDLTKPLQEPLIRFADSARGAFDKLKPSISNITASLAPLIDQIGAKLAPLAEKLGPLLESMFESGKGPLLALIDGMGPLIDGFKKMFDTLNNPEVSRFVTVFMESLGRLMPMIGELLVALTPLGTEALPVLVDGFGKLVNVVINDIIPAVTEMAQNVWPTLKGVFETIGDIITGVLLPAMVGISEWIRDNGPLVENLILAFLGFKVVMVALSVIIPIFTGILGAVRLAIMAFQTAQWLLNFAMLAFPGTWIVLAVLALIAAIVLVIVYWEEIVDFLKKWFLYLEVLFQIGVDKIKALWNTAWEAVKNFFAGILIGIVSAVVTWWEEIKSEFNTALEFVKNLWSTAWEAVSTKVSEIWNTIKSTVANAFASLVATVVQKAAEIKNAVVNKFNEIVAFVSSLPGRMVSMGRDFIQGFINGVKAMAGALVNAAKGVIQGAINAAKSLLRIGSPSKLFIQFGKWTGQGFVIGINRESDNIYKAGAGIGAAAADGIKTKPFYITGLTMGEQMAAGLTAAGGSVANASSALAGIMSGKFKGVDARIALDSAAGAFGPGNRDITVVVNTGVGDPVEIGRAVVNSVKEFESVNGTRWRE